MKGLGELGPRQKRRHTRFLRKVLPCGTVYVRGECSFRMVERLHKAGLITAFISKWRMFGRGRRPFRELEVKPFGSASDKRLLPRH